MSGTQNREPTTAGPAVRPGSGRAELEDRLRRVMGEVAGAEVTAIERMTELSGGASRDTWAFDAVHGDGTRQELILQLQRSLTSGTALPPAVEAMVLAAAGKAGVPVPALLANGGDDEFGSPFLIVERLRGEAIPQRILNDDGFAGVRGRLARQYGAALGRVQAVPPDAVPGVPWQDPREHYRRILSQLGVAQPGLELGFRWLDANRPHPKAPVLVHGDYRNGNGIVDPELGLRAVIDWELAHFGDPLEDMGWFCIRAWRFGHRLPVGGFGTYEDLIAGYEEVTGTPVDREELRYWEVVGTLRWAVICIMQGATHLAGHRRDVELAATGRRACEAEFDLLLLLP